MPHRHCLLLRKDLDDLLEVPQWPSGIRLGVLRPELMQAVHDLLVLGYRDGSVPVADFANWREHFTTDAEYDPTLCLIAMDEQGLAGVAQCWTSAYIKDLVVHPRRRGQGLGLALLRHAFQVFASRGEAFVDLKVMENNLPARRLYDSAGMRFIQRYEVSPAQA
ncbi:N-acetyltransferase [Pseudomonas gingeri NCPPB 3146 = LMG 5327]|uniref:GNAT family N-acetyltransferase n=2 Tax=Pseudomonas gingeri TaxID=117681 RepID=A0A7Y7Y3G6_9PSED|nr:GNAT family N-acetyltransferase [Pseudomonas gingeri]NVZ60850.1 GNAT family N-acetyltransferase [Pseudomonas gingeri]NVZ77820.1 GNAT family N-acetyltransferase [Pseudomonas gingeri]NWC17131.1 GNAT family N-acetyltransferase [Pseudomonas gingeri]PNQ92039.1 N-acetyltransferase [Pseudomonas gingeri NCPPB 3146 = LMG 5327]